MPTCVGNLVDDGAQKCAIIFLRCAQSPAARGMQRNLRLRHWRQSASDAMGLSPWFCRVTGIFCVWISPAGAGVCSMANAKAHAADGCAQLACWLVVQILRPLVARQARWLVLSVVLLKNSSGAACCLQDAAYFRVRRRCELRSRENLRANPRSLFLSCQQKTLPSSATDYLLVTPSSGAVSALPAVCSFSACPHLQRGGVKRTMTPKPKKL